VRYQTPQGSARHPSNRCRIPGFGPVSRYLPSALGPVRPFAAGSGNYGGIAWQTDTDHAEAAWAIALENAPSDSFLGLLPGQIQALQRSESKVSLDGKPE